ncbi:hypothetical protein HRbin09_00800 [bacterium HR09]|nr:hypothetical protein HRbin09_00800 [bacterium HR09]
MSSVIRSCAFRCFRALPPATGAATLRAFAVRVKFAAARSRSQEKAGIMPGRRDERCGGAFKPAKVRWNWWCRRGPLGMWFPCWPRSWSGAGLLWSAMKTWPPFTARRWPGSFPLRFWRWFPGSRPRPGKAWRRWCGFCLGTGQSGGTCWWRWGAGWSPMWPALPPRFTCGGFAGWRCPPPWWGWWTRPLAVRPALTSPRGKTWWGPFGSRAW